MHQKRRQNKGLTWSIVLISLLMISLLTSGIFSSIRLAQAAAHATLPLPWQTRDIGHVTHAGSVSVHGGTFVVGGSGSDIWGNADQFRYVYQPMQGNGEISARVQHQIGASDWSKAAVMIRESLADNSADAMTLLTPRHGAAFQWRSGTGRNTSTITPGPMVRAPYWIRIVRSGTTLQGFISANSSHWRRLGSVSLKMAQTVYIGLAVTSHNHARLSTATFDDILLNITPPPPPMTPSPTIEVTVIITFQSLSSLAVPQSRERTQKKAWR